MADIVSPSDDEPVLTLPWAAHAVPGDENGPATIYPPGVMFEEGGRLKISASGTIPPGARFVALQAP